MPRRWMAPAGGLALIVLGAAALAAPTGAFAQGARPDTAKPAASAATSARTAALTRLQAIEPGLWPRERLDSKFLPEIDLFSWTSLFAAAEAAEKLATTRAPADAIAGRMALGHVLTLVGEDKPAIRVLTAALAAADRLRWGDRKSHVALTHLAALLERAGDAAAARFAARARACKDPCREDAVVALFDAAVKAPKAAPQPVTAAADNDGVIARYRTQRRILDSLVGADTDWHHVLLGQYIEDHANDLPWFAIELQQELVAMARRAKADNATLSGRLAQLAIRYRIAGEYRQSVDAATEAESLIADKTSSAAFEASYMRVMGRARAGEEGAALELDGLTERWLAMPNARKDVSDAWSLTDDLVALKRWRKADEMLAWHAARRNHRSALLAPLCSAVPLARIRVAFEENREGDVAGLLAGLLELFRSDATCELTLYERAAMRAQLQYFADAKARDLTVKQALLAAIPDSSRPPYSGFAISGSGQPLFLLRVMTAFRDLGLVHAAAAIADGVLLYADAMVGNATYVDAQRLWQLAYTLALGGRGEAAFEVMTRAADIAFKHSIKNANSTDGGSLQLLKRDKWRYLLIVDIAWAISQGRPPEEMLVPAKY